MVSSGQQTDTAINLVSYAVLGNDKSLYITLINKTHEASAQEADVTLHVGSGFTNGKTIALTFPNNDISLKQGLTLGGNPINDNGTWTENWTNLPMPPTNGQITVKVPPASVLLVKLNP